MGKSPYLDKLEDRYQNDNLNIGDYYTLKNKYKSSNDEEKSLLDNKYKEELIKYKKEPIKESVKSSDELTGGERAGLWVFATFMSFIYYMAGLTIFMLIIFIIKNYF